MIEIQVLLVIFILHFIGDSLLQSDKMAQNKSTSIKWLSIHSMCYILPFIAVFTFYDVMTHPGLFLITNMLMHGFTDSITSKITSKLWKEEKVHWFFVTIGFDQMIHAITLIGTYYLFI